MTLPPYAEFLGLRLADERRAGDAVHPRGARAAGLPPWRRDQRAAGDRGDRRVAARAGGGAPTARIKPVNVTVDFMRGGREKDTFARGTVTRLGNRVANVEATAWQDDPAKPIRARAMTYLIVRASA